MKLIFEKAEGKISVDYADVFVPSWFKRVFRDTCLTYYYSALKPTNQYVTDLDVNLRELLKTYNYESFLDHIRYLDHGLPAIPNNPLIELKQDHYTVMLSGGMDSVHTLLRLIEIGVDRSAIQCIYVKNLNRSETFYEVQSVQKICERLHVRYRIIDLSTSIRPNHAGHNIGLREQLILCLAIPYIVEFGSQQVYYGFYKDFEDVEAAIVTAYKGCFEKYLKYTENFGFKVIVNNHPDYPNIDEMGAAKEMIENYPEYVHLISSCYTQQNFREQHHARVQNQFEGIKIYHGCGYCIKCLKINALICRYGEGSLEIKKGLAGFIKEKVSQPKFAEEETREKVLTLLSGF